MTTARRRGALSPRLRMALCGVSAVAVGALFLSACSSGSPTTAGTTTTTTSSGNSGNSGGQTTTSTTASSASAGARNLAATAAVKSALTAAYVAHSGLPASQVAGTAPNSVYYGFLPSTNTYWAVAEFLPIANADYNTQVAMQDDGCCGVFTMSAGGSWTYAAGYLGQPCPGQIPASLQELWHLTSPGDCGPAPTTTTSS